MSYHRAKHDYRRSRYREAKRALSRSEASNYRERSEHYHERSEYYRERSEHYREAKRAIIVSEANIMKYNLPLLLIFCFLSACNGNKRDVSKSIKTVDPDTTLPFYLTDPAEEPIPLKNDTIIDSDYRFEQAVEGSNAPQSIIAQLALFDVFYVSVDGKIHRGQILSNKAIAEDIRSIFMYMLEKGFVVEKAIPIVRYDWNDSLSMDDNNSYSFCYRDITYSKHASGMAIDINPRFNPVRWKTENRPNQPEGAVLDTTVNGTFYHGHPVVDAFKKQGFRWGHSFTKFYDDHHFEKRE